MIITAGKIFRIVIRGSLLLLVAAVASVIVLVSILYAAYKIDGFLNPDPRLRVHTDVIELKNMINLDIPITAVKWQTFSSPEDDGLLWPAQDVQTILIAEIDLSDTSWFKPTNASLPDRATIVKESPRPWLSKPVQTFLRETVDENSVLAKGNLCGSYQVAIRTSGRLVDGYICKISGKILLYLPVHTPN